MSIQKRLQELSGTKKDEAGAANAWAGTTGLETQAALNAKAGTRGLGLNAVVRALTGGAGEARAELARPTKEWNIARGASVTVSSGASGNEARITDGVTADSTLNAASVSTGPQSATVDLGVSRPVSAVKVWHYHADGRKYHDTKTEVSADGATWTTVHDGSIPVLANLLSVNQSGLETDTTGWAALGNTTIARSTAFAYEGVASLAMTPTAAGSIYATTPRSTAGVPVTAGLTYTASVFFRASVATKPVAIAVVWLNSSGVQVGSSVFGARVTAGTSGWTQATCTATAPATTAYAALTLVHYEGVIGEAVYADGISLRERIPYVETSRGVTHAFPVQQVRYVRDWVNGNSVDTGNHWVEIQASGVSQPSTLGLLQWYRADDLSLADGAAVASWLDASGNGWDVSQSTAGLRPTFVASALNGRPAVRFTAASSQFLQRTGAMAGYLNGDPGYTAFAVVATHSSTGATQVVHFASIGTDQSTTRARHAFSATSRLPSPGGRRLDADAAIGTVTGASGSGSTLNTFAISTQSISYHTATASAWRDGTLVAGPSALLTAGTTSLTDSQATRIGCQSTGSGLYLDGSVAELLVYDRVLSDSERRAVHAYLGQKYGMAVGAA